MIFLIFQKWCKTILVVFWKYLMMYFGQFRFTMNNQPTIVSYTKITKLFTNYLNLRSEIFFSSVEYGYYWAAANTTMHIMLFSSCNHLEWRINHQIPISLRSICHNLSWQFLLLKTGGSKSESQGIAVLRIPVFISASLKLAFVIQWEL